jgi:cytochrome c peroxidase
VGLSVDIVTVAVLISTSTAGGGGDPAPRGTARRIRRPEALALSRDGDRLFVANGRSGSLSVIDARLGRVIAEHDIGLGLADLTARADGRHLLAVDRTAGELLLLAHQDPSVRVVERLKVSPDPVRVRIAPGGASCVVASLWSRRLTFVALASERDEPGATSAPSRLRFTRSLDLPFCPRNLAWVRGETTLIVADAFGGKLAVIEARSGSPWSVRSLPAHNIRGLATTPDGRYLVLAHQSLDGQAQATRENVHWGMMIGNHLRVIGVADLLAAGPDSELQERSRLIRLGTDSDGAGDPAEVALLPDGGLAVALAGVGEVAIRQAREFHFFRTTVGRPPTALALAPDGETLFVADTLDDTISAVGIYTGTRRAIIPLGPRPEPDLIDRGERLFYDAQLSHDGWLSCHSCHTDGHTNGGLSDTLGDGSYGAPKRIPSLLGVATTGPWSWTGQMPRLEDQVRKSIATTLNGRAPTDAQIEALTAFLRALPPPPPSTWASRSSDREIARGREVFDRECTACHPPPNYTSASRYDVGLTDEVGNRRFNPPSLRGVGHSERLLHDARADSLEDLFRRRHHPPGVTLSDREIADVIAFLRTL